MARPGIMLYFDILEPIKVLPDADKGQLLVAMLEYGKYGVEPQFDGILALAWGFVKPKLDRDEEAYQNATLQRKYAGFCKKRSSRNLPKISFEEWLEMDEATRERVGTRDIEPNRADIEPNRSDVPDASRYPSTSTTAAASASTSSSTSTSAAGTRAADADALATEQTKKDFFSGELGNGIVTLNEAQVDDLMNKLGVYSFVFYVDKLADFIVQNDAHVRNHYETILKWWRQDAPKNSRRKAAVPKGASGQLGQAELDAIRKALAEE